MTQKSHISLHVPWNAAYLQDEDEVVDGFAPLVDVVVGGALVVFTELDLMDDVGVAKDSQQHLVWDLRRAEQAHLCKHTEQRGLSLMEQACINHFFHNMNIKKMFTFEKAWQKRVWGHNGHV